MQSSSSSKTTPSISPLLGGMKGGVQPEIHDWLILGMPYKIKVSKL